MSLFAQIRDNPRLQVGLLIIAGIVGGVALHDWSLANGQFAQQTARKAREIARLQADADPQLWQQRSKQARTQRDFSSQALWPATSTGLAQAQFQQWLNRVFSDAKASKVRITGGTEAVSNSSIPNATDSAASNQSTLKIVPMRLNINLEPVLGTVENIVATLEGGGKRVTIESLTVRKLPVGVAEIQLVGYALVGTQTEIDAFTKIDQNSSGATQSVASGVKGVTP